MDSGGIGWRLATPRCTERRKRVLNDAEQQLLQSIVHTVMALVSPTQILHMNSDMAPCLKDGRDISIHYLLEEYEDDRSTKRLPQ